MKNFALPKIYLLLALLPVLTFVACGEEDDQTTPAGNTEFNGSYNFTYNGDRYEYDGLGVSWEGDSIPFVTVGDTTITPPELINFGITEAIPEEERTRSFIISFVNYLGTGNYNFINPLVDPNESGVYVMGFVDTISDEVMPDVITISSFFLDSISDNYVNVTTDNNNRFEAEFRVVLETGEVMEGSMQFEK